MRHCHDCDAAPGELHKDGCGTERCARCGGQRISCHCVYEINGVSWIDAEFEPGATMYEKLDAEIEKLGGRLPWTGMWPGKAECIEFGWYCRFDTERGWVQCDADDPEAVAGLTRLDREAHWDKVARRWVRNDCSGK